MASLRDILVFSIILFIIGLAVVMSNYISHSIALSIINSTTISSNPYANATMTAGNAAINMGDYIYLGLFIGLLLFIIVSAWFVSDYPIFAPIYFFGLVIVVFVSYVLQGSWLNFLTNSVMGSTALNLPITSFILSNLCYFTAVAGLIGLVLIYGKPKGEASV